jgi:hypothetical protein
MTERGDVAVAGQSWSAVSGQSLAVAHIDHPNHRPNRAAGPVESVGIVGTNIDAQVRPDIGR